MGRARRRQRWLALVGAGALLGAPLRAQVVWEPVTPKQAEESQILVPAVDGGGGSTSGQESAPPIAWEPVEEPGETRGGETKPSAPVTAQAVVWEPVPADASSEGAVPAPTTVVWEPLPGTEAIAEVEESTEVQIQVAEGDGSTETITQEDSTTVRVEEQETPPPEALAIEQDQPSRVPELPPPPPLQALNRSIAFGDGLVGPDIGWQVPNGFRWSQRWFADASIRGFSRRPEGSDFFAWNNGDGNAIISANILQTTHWSLGLNTSFRSVYQGDDAAGGSTAVGEGVSSGFRIARQIGDTGGIAFGGEQILQWDEFTDTGRNFYLMASKGWWLGSGGKDYPLLIANGGFGTTKFAQNKNLQFACINNVQNRQGTYAIDNNLCWGPIGTVAVVFNEWWGMFLEYNSFESILGASINLTGGIPMRLTWGVNFAQKDEFLPSDEWNWVFRASIGF
ncbi:hypothetical protein [Synechococcus sp. WH 8101]|uniref:hypothetical protein n=1 Tax=Synechococcus sp. WH 8101 TaxID=59932 RepID=UPI0020C345E8|nr:hypothetical protein [Synechococcus sp. WH 8101]